MDELEEHRELDRLIAEQEKDDSTVFFSRERGHEHDISIEGMEDVFTLGEGGEVVADLPRERGAVLVGAATYHGTIAGYTKHKCKCVKCKTAKADYMREYMRDRRAKQGKAAA